MRDRCSGESEWGVVLGSSRSPHRARRGGGASMHGEKGDAAALYISAKEASRGGNEAEAYRLLSEGLELEHRTELRSELLFERSVVCARLNRWEEALQASAEVRVRSRKRAQKKAGTSNPGADRTS